MKTSMAKGNSGNSYKETVCGSRGEDLREDSGAKTARMEKVSAKELGGMDGRAGEVVNRNYDKARSSGSHFARLEDMEDLDRVEMDTEEQVDSAVAARGAESRVELIAALGKGKQTMGSGKSNGLGGVVLKAYHPGLVEGSKSVHLVGNPDGHGV